MKTFPFYTILFHTNYSESSYYRRYYRRRAYPFYTNLYYKNKLSATYQRHMFKYKRSKYNRIVRYSVRCKDFIIYPNYAMLMKKANKRRPKK